MFYRLVSVYLIVALSSFPLHAGVFRDFYQRLFNNLNSNEDSGYQPINDGSPAVGAVTAQFSVNQMGSAQLNIPIAVAPGTAGMAPQLSLSYDSQAPNSFGGMGFGLQGLTSIARCPADNSRNGRIHGVNFTDGPTGDIYCLNGQQLVALNGVYGADGTEYRIYQDSYTKVISHGLQGGGPSWFAVYAKNGQIATYGNVQDSPSSQMIVPGAGTVSAWNLSKISDRASNYLVVSYMQDQNTAYPIRVDYTGNTAAGLQPYNSVSLAYEDRNDVRDLYQTGSHIVVAKRLSKVTSFNGSDILFTYQLAYEYSPETGISRLTGVTECAGDSSCLKPVAFKWSDPPSSSHEEQMSLNDERLGVVKNDLLISMTGSLGDVTTVTYKPLTDPSVYTKGSGSVYPVQEIQEPMYVVAQTSSDDGVGGQHATNYFYTAARVHLLGFGFLGFETVKKTDQTTGIVNTSTFSQDTDSHLQQMLLSSVTALSNGTVIAKTTNAWTTQTTGNGQLNGTVYAPLLSSTTKQAFELDGSSTSTTATNYAYDNFGNATQAVETATDATGSYVTSTSNQYENDESNWILGKLDPVTVLTSVGSNTGVKRQSSFAYNNDGFLMSEVVEPQDSNFTVSTSYTRDVFGNANSTTVVGQDITARTTSVKFDTRGQFPIQWTNALGQKTSATYDSRFGKPATQTDFNGLVTKHVYDSFGREVSVIRPDGVVTATSFAWCDNSCPAGAVYSSTTQVTKSAPVTVYIDILGRTLAKKTLGFSAEPIWEETVYDDLGRIIKSSAPHFVADALQWTLSDHDVLGRVTKTSFPNGGVTTYKYQGLTVSMTDALGHTSSKTSNVRGWMTKTVDAAGSVTSYQYDTRGNLTTVTDSKGNQIVNVYDLKGRKTSMQDPDLGTWNYNYDVLNQLINQTDAMGNTTTFSYDVLGRMTSRTDPAGTSTWEYDTAPNGTGLLAKVNGVSGLSADKQPKLFINDAESMLRGLTRRLVNIMSQRQSHEKLGLAIYSESYTYDSLSRLRIKQVQIDGENFNTVTGYDAYSRVVSATYPSGVVEQRQYTDLGYLSEIDDGSGKLLWKAITVDARGQITKESLGNGVSTTRSFDNQTGLVTGIQAGGVLALGYIYDLVGNLVSRSDGAQQLSESFEYGDQLNRLTKYTSNGAVVTYQYDEIGNIVNKSDVGDYVYGGNGAGPHAVTATSHPTISRYTYDKNGNQLTRINVWNFVSRSVSYTSFGTPLHIETLGGKIQVDFKYDANRNRFIRTDTQNGIAKTTLYLGAYERITSADNSVEHRHALGGVAVYTQTTDSQGKVLQAKTSYLHVGNLGSIEAITDESGQVIQRFHYDPFGVQTVVQGSMSADAITYAGFTGQEEIAQMNLIHMNGRMYDPVLGRFVTPDPFIQAMANSQSLNRYSYVVNNPMTNVDPSGYSWFSKAWHHVTHAVGHALHDIGHAIGAALRNKFVDLVANIVIGACTMGAGWVVSGLAEAAFSAAVTEANGGSLGDVLKSAAMTFATAAVWHEEGELLEKYGMGEASGKWIERSVIHGVTGGALNVVQGGKFKDGFISAATAEVVSMKFHPFSGSVKDLRYVFERTAMAAVVGGTATALTGGNFVNGAKTAAFAELYNDITTAADVSWQSGMRTMTANALGWAHEHPFEAAGLVLLTFPFEIEIGGAVFTGEIIEAVNTVAEMKNAETEAERANIMYKYATESVIKKGIEGTGEAIYDNNKEQKQRQRYSMCITTGDNRTTCQ